MVGIVKRVNISKEKIKQLYQEVKKISNNFEDVNVNILAENSQRIVIFRLALGLSSQELANFCNRSQACVYNLEKKEKKINFNISKYYIEVIKKFDLKKAKNFKIIEKNYTLFFERAVKGVKILSNEKIKNFAKKGSMSALRLRRSSKELYYKASLKGIKSQGLTVQEKEIVELLEKANIKYKVHEFIGKENADIYIESENLIINCCRVRNNNNVTKHARRLMYQGYRVKYNNPKIKYFVILSNNEKNLEYKTIPLGTIDLLNEICDKWFIDSNLHDFLNIIKG